MWRWLVVLCACNQVYGVDETAGPDSDRDGVLDGSDNCTLIANRDQRDRDRDGLGDACDPCVAGAQSGSDGDADGVDDACDVCLTGVNHDEDGDAVADGCDVCPAEPDDQADFDRDGIGDACDRAPDTANERALFDGFAPPRPGWNTGFLEWGATGDGFGPLAPVEGNFTGAWHPASQIGGAGWWVETDAVLPVAAADNRPMRIVAVTSEGGMTTRTCGVVREQGIWRPERGTAAIVVGSSVRLSLRGFVSRTECWIDGVLVHVEPHAGTIDELWPLFDARIPAELRWIDVVR